MSETVSADKVQHWPRLAALSLAMLLPSLGTSITNVALPSLSRWFHAPMSEVQWVVIAYLLAVTSLIVGAGRLGDLVGRRRLLLTGMALFSAASAICALSPSLSVLIAARAVQGAGGAVMMTLTVAMVGDLVPKDRTGSAMGLLGTVSAVGTALGPTMGGALIAAWGWPSVFAALAAMGVVTVLAGGVLFPGDVKAARPSTRFDLPGLFLLALSLGTFSAAFTLGGRMPGLASLGLSVVSALAFAAFVRTEARAQAPLVRLDLLRDRTLGTGLASLMLVSAIVMATLVVGPFYLSGVLGLDPVEVGMVMSIGPAVAAVTGVPAGRLVDRTGSFPVIVGGLLAVMLGSLLLTILPCSFGAGGYAASLVVITFGYAMFQAANMTAIMQTTTSDQRGVTSALLGLARNMGLIWGASAMAATYTMGPKVAQAIGFGAGGGAGLIATFALSAGLAGVALGAAFWAGRRG
ncbi:MFS transporter [Albidovulum sediminis]|uniref:MFS transporter n=1 Tax=Albidovulum sediminis TaxID=3066345 RepID=A0ABT2NJ03_9RHOB|nr:MFS transporter [Defluviimonas sediminis]MCT8328887.1 MFS transporter [Defluviimonas sediminis]